MDKEVKLNILVAYPYCEDRIVEYIASKANEIRFVLDSGAFTAWKLGKPIELNSYCKFIDNLPFEPWRYFNLDVIGDGSKSKANYHTMRERGFTPIPIFTRGEDIRELEEYYKTSDLVGIGGLVGTKANKGFVKGIMNYVGDRKVHWLGFNAKEFLAHYKPYMCDSSSWSAAVRFASVKLYDVNGIWHQVGKKDFVKRPQKHLMKLIESYGIDPTLLGLDKEWANSGRGDRALEILTCRSWTRYQIDVKKKLGVNFFLACASAWQVKLMHDSWLYWTSKNRF